MASLHLSESPCVSPQQHPLGHLWWLLVPEVEFVLSWELGQTSGQGREGP